MTLAEQLAILARWAACRCQCQRSPMAECRCEVNEEGRLVSWPWVGDDCDRVTPKDRNNNRSER